MKSGVVIGSGRHRLVSPSQVARLAWRSLARQLFKLCLVGNLATLAVLGGCGGGGGGASQPPADASGTALSLQVTGLTTSEPFTVKSSSGEELAVSGNGTYSFSKSIPMGGDFALVVATQPNGQTCSVANGTGSGSGVTAKSIQINLTCSATTYIVGGVVNGLAPGAQVRLLNNSSDSLTLTADGAFSFKNGLAHNASYSVVVSAQPVGQLCSVGGASGAGLSANVNTLAVVCSTSTYVVGGTVAGLRSGQQVTLKLNGSDALTLTSDQEFTFPVRVAYSGSFSATVSSQPLGATCSISDASAAGITADTKNIRVTCAAEGFPIMGHVIGLNPGKQLTLYNNGSDPLTVDKDGFFAFAVRVPLGGSYSVTVSGQPIGQTCTAAFGSGAGVVVPALNVTVLCAESTLPVSGSLTGLSNGQQVTIFNNGSDSLTLRGNGSFEFPTPIAFNGSYLVTVSSQPNGQTCTVRGGGGSSVSAAIRNVSIECARNSFSVGGTLSGLAAGRQLTLNNNGADPLTLTGNGGFQFVTPIAAGSGYLVTVGTQPVGQVCAVANGAGSSMSGDLSNLQITCQNGFTVGGTVAGLGNLTGLVIANGADLLTIPANATTFTLPTRVAQSATYNVTVRTQPTSAAADTVSTVTCAVNGGGGTMGSQNANNVNVTCGGTIQFNKPGSYLWQVPQGVTQLTQAGIAGGGGAGASRVGGSGALVITGPVAVGTGTGVSILVGAGGANSAGGGASAITFAQAQGPYAVAGGGGSGGYHSGVAYAGKGGNADIGTGQGEGGERGSIGFAPPNQDWVDGGGGGAGGIGGSDGLGLLGGAGSHGAAGSNGAIAAGGKGGTPNGTGGSGGGGYGGGGGAGSGYSIYLGGSSTGGGGGGGGSLIPVGASAVLGNNAGQYGSSGGDGSVVIKY